MINLSKKQLKQLENYSNQISIHLANRMESKSSEQVNIMVNISNGGISDVAVLETPIKKIIKIKKTWLLKFNILL